MTQTLHPLRTQAETRDRDLPSPSDPAWLDSATVPRLLSWVDPVAHGLSHPRAVHGCPWCPPAEGEPRGKSAETTWREDAERRPSWSGATA